MNSPSNTLAAPKDKLKQLFDQGWLKRDQVWQASRIDAELAEPGIATGYLKLDQQLPNQGWPGRGLTEILHDQSGLGELRLLLPALAHISQTQNRWIIWVNPPYMPYAPALANAGINLKQLLVVTPKQPKDQLWVIEKALASGSCSGVMAWPGQIQYKQLRRLQVASKTGDCLGVLYRPGIAAQQASPAELRIHMLGAETHPSALNDNSTVNLQILKRKGGWATEPFKLSLTDTLNQQTPVFSELHIPTWEQQPDLVYMEQLATQRHVY